MENSESSCCKNFFSILVITIISIRLINWDYQTISDYLSFAQFNISHLWVLAICLTLSATWFSLPLILLLISCEKQELIKFIKFFLLVVCGPNLFIWTCIGVYINGFRFKAFRSAEDGYKLHFVNLFTKVFTWGIMFALSLLCCRKIFIVVKKWIRKERRRKEKKWEDKLLTGVELVGKECSVCLESFGDMDLACELKCFHFFHGKCIENWMASHGTCPLCRASYSE